MNVLTFSATRFEYSMRFGDLRKLLSRVLCKWAEKSMSCMNVPWDLEAFRTFLEMLYCPDVDITWLDFYNLDKFFKCEKYNFCTIGVIILNCISNWIFQTVRPPSFAISFGLHELYTNDVLQASMGILWIILCTEDQMKRLINVWQQ